MATRSGASLPLKKKFESFQQRSSNSDTTSSKQSTGVVIRNMARAATGTVTKRMIAIVSSHFTNNANSNVHDGVGKILSIDPLKGKSIQEVKTKHQSPFFEVEDHYNNNSSTSSPRKAALLQFEVE